jgi:hypothetical protein
VSGDSVERRADLLVGMGRYDEAVALVSAELATRQSHSLWAALAQAQR